MNSMNASNQQISPVTVAAVPLSCLRSLQGVAGDDSDRTLPRKLCKIVHKHSIWKSLTVIKSFWPCFFRTWRVRGAREDISGPFGPAFCVEKVSSSRQPGTGGCQATRPQFERWAGLCTAHAFVFNLGLIS